ncbi:MAG: DUF2934 domain-containing protein [Saprospiraceae bacterium]|nr:DUF2934 domain-containing protein [Saprospiraceae bacterium]
MSSNKCMCSGGHCPQKDSCLRFTGAVYGRQDFFVVPPYSPVTEECVYYLDDRPTENAIRKQANKLWKHDGCPEGKEMDYWMQAETYLLELKRNSGLSYF